VLFVAEPFDTGVGVGYAEKILKAQHFNLAMSTLTVHCSAIDLTARVKSGSRSKS